MLGTESILCVLAWFGISRRIVSVTVWCQAYKIIEPLRNLLLFQTVNSVHISLSVFYCIRLYVIRWICASVYMCLLSVWYWSVCFRRHLRTVVDFVTQMWRTDCNIIIKIYFTGLTLMLVRNWVYLLAIFLSLDFLKITSQPDSFILSILRLTAIFVKSGQFFVNMGWNCQKHASFNWSYM